MTRAELWKLYTDRNPHWLTEGVTLTPDGIKRLFEQTWDQGYKAGKGAGNVFDSLFKDIFKK